jgi:hypothetical protein
MWSSIVFPQLTSASMAVSPLDREWITNGGVFMPVARNPLRVAVLIRSPRA